MLVPRVTEMLEMRVRIRGNVSCSDGEKYAWKVTECFSPRMWGCNGLRCGKSRDGQTRTLLLKEVKALEKTGQNGL